MPSLRTRFVVCLSCAAAAARCGGAPAIAPTGAPESSRLSVSPSPAAPPSAAASSRAPSASSPAGAAGEAGAAAPPSEAAAARAAPRDAPAATRLTARGYTAFIWPRPRASGRFLGYVRVGDSVALRSAERVRGEACAEGFFAVEPRGYVCADRTVTLSPEPRFLDAAAATAASPGPLPYRYALSQGAPMYNRVPTADEQARAERPLGPPALRTLPRYWSSHEELAVAETIAPSAEPPAGLDRGEPLAESRLGLVRQTIPLGSMLSYTRAFEAAGRTWLLSADMTLVPADRVRPFRPSSFRGVRLGADAALPIGWARVADRPRYRLEASGELSPSGRSLPLRSWVALTGERLERGGGVYLATREPPAGENWVAEADITTVEALKKRPAGVAEGQKWIHVRIQQGTLVAYEGMTPVYATLISPGVGGVPVAGQDPVRMSTTPLGTYYVTFKDRAATMSPEKGEGRSFWIADVPHTIYFAPPFALHAAYWHERFGEPVSAGCVNLSPLDAEAIFAWSDPAVPEGWQGATGAGAPENGPTTAVVVWR